MNKRVWALVALFAGIVTMLALWVVMSSDATTAEVTGRASKKKGAPMADRVPVLGQTKAVPLRADRGRVTVADLAERQKRIREAQGGAEEPPPPPPLEAGVFALDQEGVASAVEQRRADLDACYQTALLHTPGLSGKMTLALQIEPADGKSWGTVKSVDSDSAMDATVLEGCIATVFEGLRFDGTEPVTIRYPVSFAASGPPKP